MKLYIAYKNYSSWSLRPWLLMQVHGIAFDECLIPFRHSDALSELAKAHAVPAQVPLLHTEFGLIWDSLAIMEYLAESYPDKPLWPADTSLRALARSASAEMHSGFSELRSRCPMNCRAQKTMAITPAIQADLDRLAAIWQHFDRASGKSEGPFLCGEFSIVDALYAPVMWRVSGYGLAVSESFERWSQAMKALPAMQAWLASAQQEPWVLEHYEAMADDA